MFKRSKFLLVIVSMILFSLFVSLAPAASISWSEKAKLPNARKFLSVETVDGKIYAIGGYIYSGSATYFNLNQTYDLATDSWTESAPMLTARSSFGSAVIGGQIYAVGGESSSGDLSSVEVFNPTSNSWTTAAAMPTPRSGLACAPLNGKVFAIGGKINGTATNVVEVYDPATNNWSLAAPMSTARYDLAVVSIDGKILAIGGRNGSKQAIVEEYDPATNSWQTKAPLTIARWGLDAVEVGGKVYALGGSYPIADVEEYDPATNSWNPTTSLNNARYGLGAAVADGKIYAIGGAKASTGAVDFNEEGTFGSSPPPPSSNSVSQEVTTHVNLEPALMLTVDPSFVEFGTVQLDAGEVTKNITANVASNGNWTLSVNKNSDLIGQSTGTLIPSNKFRFISPAQPAWTEFSTSGAVVDSGGPTNNQTIPITYQLLVDWTEIPDSYQAVHTYTVVQQ